MQSNVPSLDPVEVNGAIDVAASRHRPDGTVAWTLRKGADTAQCVLCSIGDRVELHIKMKEEVLLSQHCRGPQQAVFVSKTWRAALTTRGWR